MGRHRVAARSALADQQIPASALLMAMAEVFRALVEGGRLPRRVRIAPVSALPELAETIFAEVPLGANSIPRDFEGRWVKDAARLQTWTAKPA